jgi:pimeloyl-ACP methyl ester carboxylesterase
MTATTLDKVQVDGLNLTYRELGSGPPVLLLHGWPTSSFLWREVMVPIARSNRVLALDMPGFGGSDKPVDVRYDFEYFESALDGFLERLGVDDVALAGHDLGGPVGVHWALKNSDRVTKLALLNTLLYPEFSDAVLEFVQMLMDPEQRDKVTSPEGLEEAMRLGLADESNLTEEVLSGVRDPFQTEESREALAKAGIELRVEGFAEIGRGLGSLRMPVRIVYGAGDRILPDVAETMARVKKDLPQAEVTALPNRGHFVQEESPEEVGDLLARFFAESN